MGETVEERAGQAFGAEHLGPFVERQIGGDQGGTAFIALAEHFEQQFGAGLGQRHEAKFVDDQKLVGGELSLEPQQLLVIAGLDEFVDQRGGGDEADRETLLAGRQAQVDLAQFRVAFDDEPGVVRIVWLFTMVLGNSRWLRGLFCASQDLQTVLRCHIDAFAAMGGAPSEVLYDRMKTAVTRENRRVGIGLKTARLNPPKTLESFDFAFQPSLNRNRILALAQLDFVARAEVIHLLGPPGTGKSHLSLSSFFASSSR